MTDETKQPMTVGQAARILKQHNEWRRGDESLDMERPALIGEAIDVAIAALQPGSKDVPPNLAEQYNDVLRGLALYLGVGGYNSDGMIDPKVAHEKIMWGVDHFIKVNSERGKAQDLPPASGSMGNLLVADGLIYSLKDGVNHTEINVAMANGSREVSNRNALALQVRATLQQPAKAPADHINDAIELVERAASQELFDAIFNLIQQKGRHNEEIAYRRLQEVFIKTIKASPAVLNKSTDNESKSC